MLKKNLLRVKQRADQGLGRAEKTEVLSEDLQNAEKKVEALKHVLHNMVKKLTASLQAYNITDSEKRAKKMAIVQLATSLSENSSQLGEGMLSDVFQQCSMGLHSVGYAQQTYELTVETEVLSYFQELLDTDVPVIKKSKQQLTKLTLDMDATRSRQQSSTHSSNHSSHSHSKTESLNNELEDAEQKVASCKDQYATEMFTFISKESNICNKIIEWMGAQVSLYRTSLTHVEDMLSDLKCMTDQHTTRPVYGHPLDDHLQNTGREIALVIEACICILYHEGLEEEGLFRIAGSNSQLKKLKAAFNVGALIDMEDYYTDYHVVAGALKLYIRELPEPLLTYDLYDEFIQCMNVKDWDTKLKQMWTTVSKLPKSNFANVKYLIKFLAKLAEKSDVNKMTPSNISIVFGPNLLSPPNKDPGTDVVLSGIQNHVVETLILQHDYFFPGEFQLKRASSYHRAVRRNALRRNQGASFDNIDVPTSGDHCQRSSPICDATPNPQGGLLSLVDMTIAIAGSPIIRTSPLLFSSCSSTKDSDSMFVDEDQDGEFSSLTDVQSF